MERLSSIIGSLTEKYSVYGDYLPYFNNFKFIFFAGAIVVILFCVFYLRRHIILSLFSLYFTIMLTVLLPFEAQIMKISSMSYGPLIGFTALFGIMSFMLSSIFAKRKIIRDDFSVFSLFLIALGFTGLFVSYLTAFSPNFLTASILKDFDYVFDSSQMRTFWILASLGALFMGSFLSKKK